MFGWFDESGGSKVFWFQETKAGNQKRRFKNQSVGITDRFAVF